MIPFAGFLYFGILLCVAAPILLLAWFRVAPRRYLLAVCVFMLALQYGNWSAETFGGWLAGSRTLAVFALAQWAIATAFLRLRRQGARRSVFYVAVALALAPLALVKLAPEGPGHLIAFLGISYTTFRALDVIFGIQDGVVQDLPPVEFLTYLLFFPSVSAGPIDRYRRFRGDYRRARSRTELLTDLDAAAERIMRGILYSFVLDTLVERFWLSRADASIGWLADVSYMYAYSLHLFLDFAGYSCFAIGAGYLLGIRMPENFNRPFAARNIIEFWNRWHITLSSWLRDHVYGRFVFAAVKGRWFKDRYTAGYLGSLLAFGLMGLWHGTAARYLFYGLYHALLIVSYGMLTRPDRPRRFRLPPLLARIVTGQLVCFGFLIFSGRIF